MKDLKLKSKDTKRFIEYGWLLAHNDFDLYIHKFNFRDGVQTLAGLNHKRDIYQIASEVTIVRHLLYLLNDITFKYCP